MKLRRTLFLFAMLGFLLSASTAVAEEADADEAATDEAAADADEAPAQGTAPDGLQEYDIDAVHSSMVFRIKHGGMGFVYGMFRGFDGSVVFDEDNLAESSFQFTAEADSIFTNNETRDNHLRSPDFFAAEEYPEITFESTNIEHVNDETYRVTGDLTMRGTTGQVELMVDQTGQGLDDSGQFRRGFHATFAVNRLEYGVDEMPEGLGEYVRVIFSTQAFIPEAEDEEEVSAK